MIVTRTSRTLRCDNCRYKAHRTHDPIEELLATAVAHGWVIGVDLDGHVRHVCPRCGPLLAAQLIPLSVQAAAQVRPGTPAPSPSRRPSPLDMPRRSAIRGGT